jgi:hypothetical protein
MPWTDGAFGGPRWVDKAHGVPRTVGPGSSPAAAGDGEGDEAKPVRGSPGHRWRQRGGTTTTESGGSVSSMKEWRRARESSKARRGGAGAVGGPRGFV